MRYLFHILQMVTIIFPSIRKILNTKFIIDIKIKSKNKKIIFDENKFSKNFDYFSFGGFKVSPNNKYLMYTFDKDGLGIIN